MRESDDFVPGRWPTQARADEILPHRSGEHRGRLLETLTGALRAVTWLSPLPVGRDRFFWVFARPAGRAVAEAYVTVWAAVLVVGLVFASTGAGPYVAGLALFRYGDLVATRALVLLDPIGVRVGDARRTLALLGLHVAELALIAATIFRWQLDQRLGAAFMSGFDVVTLRGPAGAPGNWLDAARVLGGAGIAFVGLSVLAAVVRVARER